MDNTWYIDEYNRQLNDVKFYRKQDEDMTKQIQQRVSIYVQRMLKDGYIDEKMKQYLIQTHVKPVDAFSFYLKFTKLKFEDVP